MGKMGDSCYPEDLLLYINMVSFMHTAVGYLVNYE